jgi:hypothetical protein
MGIFFIPTSFDRVTSTSISIAFHAKNKDSKSKAVYKNPDEVV